MDALTFISTMRENLIQRAKVAPLILKVEDNNIDISDNENAHSRFLCRLLQYQNCDKEFIVFKNLIAHIAKNSEVKEEWNKIQVGHPFITQETTRIDLWIRGKGYCIIFENKIKGATDRPNQLARYIDIAKSYSYTPEQIYVVYLPKEGHDGPSKDKNPWISPLTGEDYEKAFKNRFIVLPKNDLDNWLKSLKEAKDLFEKKDNDVKQKIDSYLHGGRITITSANDHCFRDFYVDDYYMKNEDLEWLRKNLNYETLTEGSSMVVIKGALIDNDEKDINTKTKLLSEYLNVAYSCKFFKKNRKINSFIDQLELLREQILKEYVNNSNNNLLADKIIDRDCFPYLDRNCHLCYKFTYNNKSLYLYIGNNNRNNDTRFFCSIIAGKDCFLPDFIVDKIKEILLDKGRSKKWMAGYFNEGDYSTAICVLNKVLNALS